MFVVIPVMLLGCSNRKLRPPSAPQRPRAMVVHGNVRVDPYHWLRDKNDPNVIAHLEAENVYTSTVMAPTVALQHKLYKEFLSRLQEDDAEVPYREGDWLYYGRMEKGRDYKIYCRRRDVWADEQILLDVNALADGHEYVSVLPRAVSDDGRLLAYAVSFSAFRQHRLHVKDLQTGQVVRLGGDLDISGIAFAADNRTVFFCVEDEAKRPWRVYRQPADGSRPPSLVWEEPDRAFNAGVYRTRSGRFILIASASATTADAHYIPADRPGTAPIPVAGRIAGQEYHADDAGDGWVIRVNDAGRNFRIVAAPGYTDDRSQWMELIAHRDDVMVEDHLCFSGHIVLAERAAGLQRLSVFDRASGTAHSIAMPEAVYALSIDQNEVFDTPLVRFQYESPVTPASTFDYDMSARTLSLLKRMPVPNYDPSLYELQQQFAVAPDGVKVPISIVRRRGLPPGPRPTLLHVYGAYGLPEADEFSATRISLLDRGVVFATAHVRGGGELGKIWHEHGRLMNKLNTFSDFIACARHLIDNGTTTSARLAASGYSAGGLTVAAALNMNPELFKAAIVGVPFVDVVNTMLDDSLPLTAQEYLEWGNPHEPEAYAYMMSYSPYDNLRRQDYPAIFVPTGLDDSQVMYWEPAKYVARLRTLKTDTNPLLLHCIMTGGHGGPSGRYDDLREEAMQQAFVLWQLGIER